MKLAFCLFKYFPFGGMQRDFLRLAKACVQRGHQVDVFTMKWEGEKDPEIPVTILPCSGKQNHTRSKQFVAELAQHFNYDLIIGFNKMPGLDVYYAADTCYQAKAYLQRPSWYRVAPRYRHLINYEHAVFSPTAITEILFLSEKQQQEFQKYYHTQSQRFHFLPPGISQDRLAPVNAKEIRVKTRNEFNLQDHDKLLLFVGSGFKTKGLDRTLLALASLPAELKNSTYLFIIGKDNAKSFEKQAKQLAIQQQVKFFGGRDDVPRFLLAADLLLHPAYNESAGNVLLEAVVSGLPVLTTDVCGYAKYIKEAQTGKVLASPFRQEELNKNLVEMLLSNKQTEWRENGISFAKQADIYHLPERAAEIIEKIADSKKNRFLSASFQQMMNLKGEVFRELENRRTQRIIWNEKNYFLKQHFGVGWKEIFKNLVQFRWPVLSAKNEWRAINLLQQASIAVPEVVRYERQGLNPAGLKSFLLTQELPATQSLEEVCQSWHLNPPPFRYKEKLIKEVARIARIMHQNGINHRDFYLCHFLLAKESASLTLYLIDLHRAQVRKKVPLRWLIKDLAGLFFSSKECGLTQRDLLRFIREYRNKSLGLIFNREKAFWEKVKTRGNKLYQKHNS